MKHLLVIMLLVTGCGQAPEDPETAPTPSPTPQLRDVAHTYAAEDVRCIGADEVALLAPQYGSVATIECFWTCALWYQQPKQVTLRFSFTAGEHRIKTLDATIAECEP